MRNSFLLLLLLFFLPLLLLLLLFLFLLARLWTGQFLTYHIIDVSRRIVCKAKSKHGGDLFNGQTQPRSFLLLRRKIMAFFSNI